MITFLLCLLLAPQGRWYTAGGLVTRDGKPVGSVRATITISWTAHDGTHKSGSKTFLTDEAGSYAASIRADAIEGSLVASGTVGFYGGKRVEIKMPFDHSGVWLPEMKLKGAGK